MLLEDGIEPGSAQGAGFRREGAEGAKGQEPGGRVWGMTDNKT